MQSPGKHNKHAKVECRWSHSAKAQFKSQNWLNQVLRFDSIGLELQAI